MQLDTITELLNIQNYKAVEVTRDRYQNIYVTLEQIEDTLPVCSGCGKVHGTPVHSRAEVVVEDLRISGKRVFLLVTKRKAKCVEDNSIRVEEINWITERFTDRFAEQVYRLILMQNKVTNKKQNLLEKLASLNERVYQAMLLKEQFLSIYTDPKTAGRALKEWIIAAIKSGISAFEELDKKFFRKRHYVLNYFLGKITTAISEGINNKIKRLSRMAYGYRNVHYFLIKIHQHCGLLNPRLST